jgi:hypothetical protein
MKNKQPIPDYDLVLVAKPDRLMQSAAVEESAVAAAEIDQPKFADVLNIDERVAARNLLRFDHNQILSRAPNRRISLDREFLAARLEPRAFFWPRLKIG